jgi:hypothetical protein
MKIYGLPCCHEMADALDIVPNWTLNLRDIDCHWYFERPWHLGPQPTLSLPSPPGVRIPFIREPLVVRSSGRPRTDRTTRRNPSHWEQLPLRRNSLRHCSQQRHSQHYYNQHHRCQHHHSSPHLGRRPQQRHAAAVVPGVGPKDLLHRRTRPRECIGNRSKWRSIS